jgi:hypothetical protein
VRNKKKVEDGGRCDDQILEGIIERSRKRKRTYRVDVIILSIPEDDLVLVGVSGNENVHVKSPPHPCNGIVGPVREELMAMDQPNPEPSDRHDDGLWELWQWHSRCHPATVIDHSIKVPTDDVNVRGQPTKLVVLFP